MYNSDTKLFKVGKDRIGRWFAGSHNVSFGILMTVGGLGMLSFGVVSLFTNVAPLLVSVILAFAGILNLTILFIATKKGFFASNSSQANAELQDTGDSNVTDIQKKTDLKNEFISQLSYQIRTPLNNIVAIGGLLSETQLNNRQRDLTETILASANNLANVINVFSAQVSSLELGSKPNNVAFDLQSLMNSAVQLFVGQSEDYNIALTLHLDTPQYIFEGDPVLIKQILLNLIDATIKNKKAKKINIFISYRVNQGTEQLYDVLFEIKVSDKLDIDLEQDWGKTEMINYSISSKLISNLSGNKLTCRYEKSYTIFSFTLPFKKSDEAQLKKEAAVIPEKAEAKEIVHRDVSKVDLKEAKVLLVEDNLINQKIVILSIQKLVKSITVANNGQEAVEKFKTSKHDIILMDIQMPVMDGIQATKKIRELELEKRIVPTPIIAITANALAGDREHCLASGMDEYISKPFQVETLVGKMKNLLAIGSSIND